VPPKKGPGLSRKTSGAKHKASVRLSESSEDRATHLAGNRNKSHHPGRRKPHRTVLTTLHWTERGMPFPGRKRPLKTRHPAWPKTGSAMHLPGRKRPLRIRYPAWPKTGNTIMQGLSAIQQKLSLPLLGQLSSMIVHNIAVVTDRAVQVRHLSVLYSAKSLKFPGGGLGLCCSGGKVSLPLLPTPIDSLKSLL